MRDEDDGLTRERDRRVQGGILIAMVVMVVVGVSARFSNSSAFLVLTAVAHPRAGPS